MAELVTIEVQRGEYGSAALHTDDRRLDRRDPAIEKRWARGRVGRVVRAVNPVQQSTESRPPGAGGERGLSACLARRTSDDVVLLHDRSVRNATIDHIAVASSGVWVIDATPGRGRVERRDFGTWRASDHRLYVGGRDRTRLVGGLGGQAEAVRSLIEPLGVEARIHSVLCFVDAEWGLLAKPFDIGGVTVTYPTALAALVSAGGLLLTAEVRAIVAELDRALSPA